MTVCLQYQSVYVRRDDAAVSKKLQLLVACCLLCALVARVWVKLESTDVGYQLARERQKTVALDMERRELELQLSVLKRPDALAKSARAMVGLGEHLPGQTIKISY
jgi:hypothetical protein